MSISRTRALETLRILEQAYPNYHTLLMFSNAYELLIAVILSAQTTDEQVNKATPHLFKKYPTADMLAQASHAEVEHIIFTTGFYRNKTKNIIAAASALVHSYDGIVPNTMEALTTLPGVGRKTAGVVLFHIYHLPAIIVDTHFGRLCRRLQWTTQDDPTKVEFEIRALLPQDTWGLASMVINFHGRRVCKSRKPECHNCVLYSLCPSKDHAQDIK